MAAVRDSTRGERLTICADVRHPSSPANKSLRGSRGPEAGVRGIPSPFINLDERGRDTPHPSLLPLVPMRKDFLDEVLWPATRAYERRRKPGGINTTPSNSKTPCATNAIRAAGMAPVRMVGISFKASPDTMGAP